jgi:hypothetical protein
MRPTDLRERPPYLKRKARTNRPKFDKKAMGQHLPVSTKITSFADGFPDRDNSFWLNSRKMHAARQ